MTDDTDKLQEIEDRILEGRKRKASLGERGGGRKDGRGKG